MWKVLVIDDDRLGRESITDGLAGEGFSVVAVPDGPSAVIHLDDDLAAALVDLKLARADGSRLFRQMRDQSPAAAVVLLAGYSAAETAVASLQEGAFDYLVRPVKRADLVHKMRRAIERREMIAELARLRARLDERFGFASIVGNSPPVVAVLDTARLVADTRSPVLVVGEKGTGKELLARTLHQNSGRRRGPFLVVNCAAVPSALPEAEWFRHFQAAQGGTLLLKAVEYLTPPLQDRLFRALDTGRILPSGGGPEIAVDVRLVAATQADLRENALQGTIREDLAARLRTVEICLPPLRERAEDVPLLVHSFIDRIAAEYRRPVRTVAPEALDLLLGYGWPGNVRELRDMLEGIIALSTAERIEVANLPPHIRSALPAATVVRRGLTMAEIEREAIRRTLEQTGGRRSEAAQILDLSVRTLQRKLKEYRFDVRPQAARSGALGDLERADPRCP